MPTDDPLLPATSSDDAASKVPPPDVNARTTKLPEPVFSAKSAATKLDEELGYVEQNRMHEPGALTMTQSGPHIASPDKTQILPAPVFEPKPVPEFGPDWPEGDAAKKASESNRTMIQPSPFVLKKAAAPEFTQKLPAPVFAPKPAPKFVPDLPASDAAKNASESNRTMIQPSPFASDAANDAADSNRTMIQASPFASDVAKNAAESNRTMIQPSPFASDAANDAADSNRTMIQASPFVAKTAGSGFTQNSPAPVFELKKAPEPERDFLEIVDEADASDSNRTMIQPSPVVAKTAGPEFTQKLPAPVFEPKPVPKFAPDLPGSEAAKVVSDSNRTMIQPSPFASDAAKIASDSNRTMIQPSPFANEAAKVASDSNRTMIQPSPFVNDAAKDASDSNRTMIQASPFVAKTAGPEFTQKLPAPIFTPKLAPDFMRDAPAPGLGAVIPDPKKEHIPPADESAKANNAGTISAPLLAPAAELGGVKPDSIKGEYLPVAEGLKADDEARMRASDIVSVAPVPVAETVTLIGAAAAVLPAALPIAPVEAAHAVVVAPEPDSPFSATPAAELPQVSVEPGQSMLRVRAPVPSGANWRTVMNEVPVAPPKPVLVAKGLIKWFGKRQVVSGVDVEVGAGEIVGLLGRNGAGKTTSFRMIMGLLHPDGGTVTYENRDVTRLPMYARANRGIGYLAQQPSIFQKLTVEENLLAVLELQEPSRKIRKERMEKLILDLGLATVRRSQAAVLSGGERRRLEIARAMSLRPRVVLFDEPFAGIDPITVTEIQGILRDLKRQGVGVLVTDHNVRETLTITDRTYIMDEGKIWIHGPPREIVANEQARSRYLGHEFRLDF